MDLEELQEKFTQYGKQLSEGDSEQKLIASSRLLRVISEYFEKNAPNTDISGITLLMGELAAIAEGNSPKFIKPVTKTAGRNFEPKKHIQDASIIAAIELLIKHGVEKNKAIEIVSSETKIKQKTLIQLRKDFYRRRKNPEAFEFLIQKSNETFDDEIELKGHILALLKMSKI